MSRPPYARTGRVNIKVDRPQQGSYLHGEWIEPSPIPFTTIGNIQPNMKWNQMQKLPEGDRSKNAIVIYCNKELLQAQEGEPARKADIVYYDCHKWEVKTSMMYRMGVLDHCEAVALRLDDV